MVQYLADCCTLLELVFSENMSGENLDLVSEPDESATDTPQLDDVNQLRLELEASKSRTLRALADFENYRARVNRQVAEDRMYAHIDLMRDLLPVWDNIGRALDAVEATQNLESLVEGVQLVHSQFLDILKKYHCERIESKFQQFDPHAHESVALIPNAEYPVNTVIEEVQVGFRLFDRVVRPSQVVLAASENNP